MHLVIEHRFERVTVGRFVDIYFSPDYNAAVAPLANLSRRELISERAIDGGRVERRIRMVPSIKLPRAVTRLLRGAAVEYTEVNTYDPATQQAHYRIESQAGERIKVWGVISFIADGDGCRRRIEGDIVVRVPGLGRWVEKLIADELEQRYARMQTFTQRYLDEQSR